MFYHFQIVHPAVPQRARSQTSGIALTATRGKQNQNQVHQQSCCNSITLPPRLVAHRCSLLCDAILHFCNVCSVKRSADATRPQRDSKGVMLNSFFFFVFAYDTHTHCVRISTTTTLLSLVMAAQRSKRSHHACYFLTGSVVQHVSALVCEFLSLISGSSTILVNWSRLSTRHLVRITDACARIGIDAPLLLQRMRIGLNDPLVR